MSNAKIGDRVLYTMNPPDALAEGSGGKSGDLRPAVVVAVGAQGRVNLRIFRNAPSDAWKRDVPMSLTGEPGTCRHAT